MTPNLHRLPTRDQQEFSADLWELAGLWEKLPEFVRAFYRHTAKALAASKS
jgi:hypothetical protein